MLRMPALGLIWAYQNFISPYKGFSCAHRVVHGGAGCSGYAKERIRESGLLAAIPDIRERLQDCRATALAARSNCDCHDDDYDRPGRPTRRRKDNKNSAGRGRSRGRGCDLDDCGDIGDCDIGGC